MGSNREYDFTTGFETSTAPAATTPVENSDIMNLGFANSNYAKLAFWGDGVADTTALKAVAAADRSDKQVRLVESLGSIWAFDSASSATEDGTTILEPTVGTGRWLIASGSGGGTSGTASSMEVLQTQNALASIGYSTPQLDNSIRLNGLEVPAHTYSHSRLIENYTSGGATIKVVHNPVVVFDSDKDYDSITGWAAVGAATTLAATAGTNKVGSNHFSWNKDGSAVSASIRHTLAAQTLSVGANYRVYFWVDMPSVTGLSNIFIKIMGAATTDFSKWDLTTNSAGGALATGYNLMFVDIANTAASSTGGTAWTTTQLARYVEVGVTTSSAGQTYTGIKVDGIWFSQGDITAFGNKYLEYTGYDTSNKNDFKMASSNTVLDGIVTLSATVAQNYTAGISAAAAAKLVRSPASWSQSGLIGFDTTLSSGTIALETEVRLTKLLRESLSGNYGAYVDMFTPQIYKVKTVGGSTIEVYDSEDHHLNLLNTDNVHIFSTTYSDGEPHFTLLATRALTANSSATGGVTTLTLTTTSIAVGDYVVKQHLTVSASVVASSADESFSTMSYDTSPNGAQLIGSKAYPNASYLWGHWGLGGSNEAAALRDKSGNNRTLVKVGSPNISAEFKSGRYGVGGIAAGSYLRTSGTQAQYVEGSGELSQLSLWFYYDASFGSSRAIWGAYGENGSVSRGLIINLSGASALSLTAHGDGVANVTVTAGTVSAVGWHHVAFQVQENSVQNVWLDGVKTSGTAPTNIADDALQAIYWGVISTSTTSTVDASIVNPTTGMRLAECMIWRNGPLLTQQDINFLYSAGNPQWIGYDPAVVRNEYSTTGQSGRRVSMKAKLNRSTTAVSPYILQGGIIKTG